MDPSIAAAIDNLDASSLAQLVNEPDAALQTDEDGQPPLIRALFASNPDKPDESLAVLDVLLGAGADPAQPDGDGSSSLHVAASKLTLEPEFASIAFEALLQRLPQEPDLLRDAEGATPLAAVVGRVRASGGMVAPEGEAAVVQSAQLLIDRGSSILGRSDAAAAASLSASYNAGADAGGGAGSAPAATLLHEAAEWATRAAGGAAPGTTSSLAWRPPTLMATACSRSPSPRGVATLRPRFSPPSSRVRGPVGSGRWAAAGESAHSRLCASPSDRRCGPQPTAGGVAAKDVRPSGVRAAAHRALRCPARRKGRARADATRGRPRDQRFRATHRFAPSTRYAAGGGGRRGPLPLMHSAANGDAVAVGLLLDRIRAAAADGGALGEGESRVLAVDRTGRSALMLAAASRALSLSSCCSTRIGRANRR